MCGITGIFNILEQTPGLRDKALSMSRTIRHRGPDWSGIYCGGSCILTHERLSIVDPQSGKQPLFSSDRKVVLAVNGEIYNHQAIREQLKGEYEFKTGSDCEVILALYKKKGTGFLEDLNGIFAFALYDEENDTFLIARDPIGVEPLYIGSDASGKIYVASELKALEGQCDSYRPFPPGYYYYSREGVMQRWYWRDWMDYNCWLCDGTLFYNLFKDSGATVDWLEENGMEFVFIGNEQAAHAEGFPTYHIYKDQENKYGYYQTLVEKFTEAGGELYLQTAGYELAAENDTITGIKAKQADGTVLDIACKAVCLCTGGFAANEEAVRNEVGSTSRSSPPAPRPATARP